MSDVSARQFLRRRAENTIAVALVVVLLVAGGILGARADGSSGGRPHYLGMRGMALAAFTGKVTLTMAIDTNPPATPSTASNSSAAAAATPASGVISAPVRQLSMEETAGSTGSQTGGAGAGKPTFSPAEATLDISASTPRLQGLVAAGGQFNSVTFTAVHRVSAQAQERLTIVLRPALKSSALAFAPAGSQQLTFEYAGLQLSYKKTS